MTILKLQYSQSKKTALLKQQRRQLSDLLSAGKEPSARIRAENIIREDIYTELLEMLELYCELLLARIGLLEQKELDPSLEEAVALIYCCTPHTDIKELATLRDLFVRKYGREYLDAKIGAGESENSELVVPEKIQTRISGKSPSAELVSMYLKEIAKVYEVPFSELSDDETELNNLELEADELSDSDDDNAGTAIKEAPVPVAEKTVPSTKIAGGDFDSLRKRFAALKRG